MLKTILDRAHRRDLPLTGLSLAASADGQHNVTYHAWQKQLVKAEWSRAPSMGEMATLTHLLEEPQAGGDALLTYLTSLPPAALQGMFTVMLADWLRAHRDLAKGMGIPVD